MKKIILASLLLALLLTGCGKNFKVMKPEEARVKAEKFINEELVSGGAVETNVSIKEISEETGLYKLLVAVESQGQAQEVESYMTRDGSKFFTQAIDMNWSNQDTDPAQAESVPQAPKTSAKQDKPTVEIFVMSHCPYGTQIEKGIIPVLEALGNKIDFKLRFCDYAMHGEVEIKEQLAQYCIQKEEPEKLIEYLKCFLETGVSSGCLAKAKINSSKLENCSTKADAEFKITANFEDKESWYSQRYPQFNVDKNEVEKYDVGGSPTLVVNGEKINNARRDSAGLLETICSAFNNEPQECNEALSGENPSPGFGYSGAGAGADGSCG